jgi:hypothetical protein
VIRFVNFNRAGVALLHLIRQQVWKETGKTADEMKKKAGFVGDVEKTRGRKAADF